MQLPLDQTHGVFDVFDSQVLHRIYARARRTVGDRIVIDDEIARRLAVIVIFAYGEETRMGPDLAADESAIAQACVDRLMAQTTAA